LNIECRQQISDSYKYRPFPFQLTMSIEMIEPAKTTADVNCEMYITQYVYQDKAVKWFHRSLVKNNDSLSVVIAIVIVAFILLQYSYGLKFLSS